GVRGLEFRRVLFRSDGIAKTKSRSARPARARSRQHHAEEAIPRAGAQGGGRLQLAAVNGSESGLQGLHDKGQRKDDRADNKACKTEGERLHLETDKERSEGTPGP